jgi:hypothetical protein
MKRGKANKWGFGLIYAGKKQITDRPAKLFQQPIILLERILTNQHYFI